MIIPIRDFLRLGSPLSCRAVEEGYQDDRCIAVTEPDGMIMSLGMDEKSAAMETEEKLNSAGLVFLIRLFYLILEMRNSVFPLVFALGARDL